MNFITRKSKHLKLCIFIVTHKDDNIVAILGKNIVNNKHI